MPQYDRWELKTAPQMNIGEIKFNNLTQPNDTAPSLLQTSAQQQQEREREYSTQQSTLSKTFADLAKTLHHDDETDYWLSTKKRDVQQRIKNFSAVGDFEGALNAAREAAADIQSDPEYIGRTKTNAEYKEARDKIWARTDLTEDAKEYWDDMNQFKTEYNYDPNTGDVIGTKEFKEKWRPAPKIDVQKTIASALGMITPNSTSKSNYNENSNETGGYSFGGMDTIDPNNHMGRTTANSGLAKITTRTSTTNATNSSSKIVELTSTRIENALNMIINTNPDAVKYFSDFYNQTKHFISKYEAYADQARRDGNEQLAQQYQQKANDYRGQLSTQNGTICHSWQEYVKVLICKQAGGIFKYRTTDTAYSKVHKRTNINDATAEDGGDTPGRGSGGGTNNGSDPMWGNLRNTLGGNGAEAEE